MHYTNITKLAMLQEYLKGAEIVAFDFETAPRDEYREDERAALDAHKAEIVGISFSTAPGSAVYVPLRHRTGCNMPEPEQVLAWLREALFENPRVRKVAHNLAFEAMFLYAQGIVVQAPCYDTIAAAQLTLKSTTAFRRLADSGLKTLVPELLDVDLPSFEEVTGGRCFDELDPQDAETVRYACADSDYALQLHDLFNAWFDLYLPKHRWIVENLESPTAVYVGIMRYNGVQMDIPAMQARQAEADTRLAELRREISFLIGDVDIGANASTAAFKSYLYNDLGLPVVKTTAKFQEAADDETMIRLAAWCREHKPELVPLFELIQEYRRWSKIKGTYLDGYLRCVNDATGRIHPDLMPLGTETGRFSCRNPNLQNCGRKDNDPAGVRRMMVAPEGAVIMELDYSQIELRVGAFYCRDERMLETYRSGGDIHAQTTAVIYHIPLEQAADKSAEHYKERRTIAKNCNFGVFYGLFPKGLQKTLKFKAGLDTSLEACGGTIENLKHGYPGLTRWQEEVKESAALRRYTETWYGRRRYLPGMASADWGKRSFAERCAMNTPIQGTAAEIVKLAMTRLVKACMEAQPFPEFDLPLVAEVGVGTNYGDLKDWEVPE